MSNSFNLSSNCTIFKILFTLSTGFFLDSSTGIDLFDTSTCFSRDYNYFLVTSDPFHIFANDFYGELSISIPVVIKTYILCTSSYSLGALTF